MKYNTPVLRRAFYRSVLDKVVERTRASRRRRSASRCRSIRRRRSSRGFIVEGQAPGDERALPQVDFKFASPDYFKTIGMTLLSGRAFTDADDATAPPVAIVNLSMARHNFPGTDPVGRRISLDNGRTWMTIVGVVNDTHDYGLDEKPTDEVYRAFAQTGPLNATLLVRTAADPAAFARAMPAVGSRDRSAPAGEPDPDAGGDPQPLAGAAATDGDAGHAVRASRSIITAAGIAGVVSFSVNQRTTEIGVRMALGAPRSSVARMIVAAGADAGADGARAAASRGALMMTRVVTRLLFAVEPTDPVTYAAVIAVLAAVAALACLAPARRAAAIDPMRALRAD